MKKIKGINWLQKIYQALEGLGTSWTKQSDWNEEDSGAPSYIKNKPTIPEGGSGGGVMIVEGTLTNNQWPMCFEPVEGSPTLDDAYDAHLNGTNILLRWTANGATDMIIGSSIDYEYEHDGKSYDKALNTTNWVWLGNEIEGSEDV